MCSAPCVQAWSHSLRYFPHVEEGRKYPWEERTGDDRQPALQPSHPTSYCPSYRGADFWDPFLPRCSLRHPLSCQQCIKIPAAQVAVEAGREGGLYHGTRLYIIPVTLWLPPLISHTPCHLALNKWQVGKEQTLRQGKWHRSNSIISHSAHSVSHAVGCGSFPLFRLQNQHRGLGGLLRKLPACIACVTCMWPKTS